MYISAYTVPRASSIKNINCILYSATKITWGSSKVNVARVMLKVIKYKIN